MIEMILTIVLVMLILSPRTSWYIIRHNCETDDRFMENGGCLYCSSSNAPECPYHKKGGKK